MNACTAINSWDTAAHALNGMDKDGDLIMLTDNEVLVSKLIDSPALMCAQRRATKKVPTEDDFIRSNIDSFGNDIGKTTNWITSMFEVQAQYRPSDPEYKELEYRIRCGQLYQQNAIDKAKGIVAKPMPREWHDRHAASMIEDPEKRKLYRDIVADKKPYFMRYIYPTLMRQYNTYIKNTNKNALREFQMTVDELLNIPYGELTERQHEFLRYYKLKLPVGVGNCVMNRICVRFEEEFDHQSGALSSDVPFDYSIMKSGAQYSNRQASEIRRLCESYNKKLQNYAIISQYEKPDDDDVSSSLACMKEEFLRECENVCQNRFVLCDIILDICYRKSSSKRFAWDICADTIIDNLLTNNGMSISAPVYDPDGDIQFRGRRYSMITRKMEEEYEDCSE